MTILALLQRLNPWHAGSILNPHFGNLSYLLPPDPAPRRPARRTRPYDDNATLWRAVITGRLTGYSRVMLRGFDLFPWLPRSPGLYHTPEAPDARRRALRYLDERFGPAPIRKIDHAAELQEGQVGTRNDTTLVFAPEGKLSMLEGGVGCIRLRPVVIDDVPQWLMSASSSGVAHEGFPLGVSIELHDRYHERLLREGALRCDISGRLMFLPRPFSELFPVSYGGSIPHLYLLVDDIEPIEPDGVERRLEVSTAISFLSDYEGRPEIYASYVTFSAEDPASYEEAISWLKTEYVEKGYRGRIVTDFDQTRTVFRDAALSLRKVMGRRVRRDELEETLELMHVRGDVDELYDEMDRRELLRSRPGVIRDSVFLSYGHNERDMGWMERARVHLESIFHDQAVDIWDDHRIGAGARWNEEIKSALARTKVAVLIVSADYLASDYVRNHELPAFLLAAESQGAKVLALTGSSCNLVGSAASLLEFQFVNPPDRPLDRMSEEDREQCFSQLAGEVARSYGL